MKKYITILAFMTVSSAAVFGQSAIFSKGTATYTHLTGATHVAADSVWDDMDDWKVQDKEITLGFDFLAYGETIKKVNWGNGFVEFRRNGGDTVVHFGLKDVDMCDMGFGSNTPKSPLMMKKEGTAGNYIVKLEWQNAGIYEDWNTNGVCKDSVNVQLWIYQNPQKFELRFGNSKIADFSNNFNPGVKVQCAKYDGVGNTSGIVLNGSSGNPTSFSFGDTAERYLTSWPASGTVYVFQFSESNEVKTIHNASGLYHFGSSILSRDRQVEGKVVVYALDGRKVATSEMKNGSANLPQLSPGMYTASMEGATGTMTLRFIAQQ